MGAYVFVFVFVGRWDVTKKVDRLLGSVTVGTVGVSTEDVAET